MKHKLLMAKHNNVVMITNMHTYMNKRSKWTIHSCKKDT